MLSHVSVFHSFLLWKSVPLHGCNRVYQFTFDGYLGCLQSESVANRAAVKIYIQVLCLFSN